MLDDFALRAALAGVGVALAATPLGCFVVWRRMAYFGDATAHAAILGVALALAFEGAVIWGVLAVALIMAVLMHLLAGRGHAMDTALGVLSHGALAVGLVAVALIPGLRVDLDAYLFGDVLTVGRDDLALIWGGAAVVWAVLLWRWQAMLTATLHPDMAWASGLNPRREDLTLTLLLALVVAVSIKVVGALLITALLIIPAAAARNLARTPEVMAALAVGIGGASAMGGLQVSLWADTPVGPTIVCLSVLAFAVLGLVRR